MEALPHHVAELILERLTVKALLRFKSISKQWRSTIQSHSFQKRQKLINPKQPKEKQHVLFVSVRHCDSMYSQETEVMRTLEVGSSVSFQIPIPWYHWEKESSYYVCDSSCDGLICLFSADNNRSIVLNPATGWYRELPYTCKDEQLVLCKGSVYITYHGFGKDKISNTYKAVCLYNTTAEQGLNNNNNDVVTVCEVFDFTTNSWRYVVPASPYLILEEQGKGPVYADGSLHWFTKSESTQVLSFDLHTETFQVSSNASFQSGSNKAMFSLDDRLCVSETIWPNQVIWSFDSDRKTWSRMHFINMKRVSFLAGYRVFSLLPLAVLEDGKVLYEEISEDEPLLVTYDDKTVSNDLAYKPYFSSDAVFCFTPSLTSIL